MYDYKTHGDFKKYYDTKQKRNYWVLGYFGGGSINILEAYTLAEEFAKSTDLPLSSIKIDEVLKSRRFKHFKFLFSDMQNQEKELDSYEMENVYAWLTD